jgi:DMSO/TMAO reductase YedYZ molybdopterin-dependent catalytic subunit
VLRPVDGLPTWFGDRVSALFMRAASMEENIGRHLTNMVTPITGYFRRDRHVHPEVDAETYKLELTGVARPRTLRLPDLHAMPFERRVCVQECAGNGNHLMGSAGLLGQAEWEGPALSTVLEACGGAGPASHFAFHGYDILKVAGVMLKSGYHYGLSVEELVRSRALIAVNMNGAPLSRRHGFPARLVVPRIYSMSHVKWLAKIEGKTAAHRGIHNTWVFTNKVKRAGKWVRVQARWIGLKSLITHCRREGEGWRLTGCAWGGDEPITGVDVSCDGGEQWSRARVLSPREYFQTNPGIERPDLEGAWCVFTYDWTPGRSGRFRVGARARGEQGALQELENDPEIHGHFDQTRVKWRDVTIP